MRPQFNVERDFNAMQLNANFDYRFSKKASIYMGYNLTNQPPALRQLQAFEDVSNPLNTIIGNPNLEPANRHRFYASFNAYNWQERTGFYVYTNFTSNNNDVVTKTIVEPETLKRVTTYDNVSGNYSGYASVSYSKSFKLDSLKTIRLRISNWSNIRKNINFNNGVQYASNVLSTTPNLGVDFTWKDVFEFKPRYRITFTSNKYDIETFDNLNFTSHNLDLNTATFLPKQLEWRNDLTYNYNPNVADGFQKSAWFWNSSLAYSIMKDKAAITLKVYDLLNQNTNARRTATLDYIQDSQSTVLRQYFMLNFSWKFNSLGAKANQGGNDIYFLD